VCHPSHTGPNCGIALGDNFDVLFNRKTSTDAVVVADEGKKPNLANITIAFWLNADENYHNGTPFSYYVPGSPQERIEIFFTDSTLEVKVKNDSLDASCRIIDGNWHFIGVIWSGDMGIFSLYLDGQELSGVQVPTNVSLVRGGYMILGQKYSFETDRYIIEDSYVGLMHQFHIWLTPGSTSHMWNAAHRCSWPIGGDVKAWVEFIFGLKGNTQKRFPTSCKALELCEKNCSHIIECKNSTADEMVCKCKVGYTGTHCDININDCTPGSCVRGKCIDGVNTYRCECPKGFWGSRCERAINDEKECPLLDDPVNGYKRCMSYSGKQVCTLACRNGVAFSSGAVIEYECGPETKWKWNGEVIKSLPKCLPSSSPQELQQRISLQFPLTQTCRTKEQFMKIAKSFREAILQTIRSLPEYKCFESGLCSIGGVKVSGCERFTGGRVKRAIGSDSITTIECTVIFRGSTRNAWAPNAAQKAGSVAFHLQYVVSTRQFTMKISENVLVARQGSLQHLPSEFTCGLGYLTDIWNSSCVGCPPGFFLDTSTKHCRECDIGSYQDTEGQVTCHPCPSGYTTKGKNSDSVYDCYRVKEGHRHMNRQSHRPRNRHTQVAPGDTQ